MTELLKKLPYWDDLTEDERQQVGKKAYIRHYKPGELLYGSCVECVGMIHILRGEARAYVLSEEGREVTLFRVEEEDNCVLSASCVLTHISFVSFMAVTKESEILIVPVKLFGDLCEQNIHVRCFAYELAARRFSSVVFVMQQILFARLDERLASFLLREYRKTGNPVIRMTHEQLATHSNSARETVGRMLKRFAEEGMIKIRRGSILLTDIQKLEIISGEK